MNIFFIPRETVDSNFDEVISYACVNMWTTFKADHKYANYRF